MPRMRGVDDRWGGKDPTIRSIVRLDDKCLGMRLQLASGERRTMPLGHTTFHMRLDRVKTLPQKPPLSTL